MTSNIEIYKALSTVIDPDFKKDLVSLNMIKDLVVDGRKVSFTIELTTPACPLKDQLESDCREALSQMAGDDLEVAISFSSKVTSVRNLKDTVLPDVRNIIAVASGKGGVGKSTVAAGLALGLAKSGARVGLLDADIHGPSLPTMLGIRNVKPGVEQMGEKHKIIPVEVRGLKVLSIGLLVDELQAVVWRGPMVSSALRQFISDVVWGELDYLIIDLPPGTGDVHLTLAQMAHITGAVIVTTPQEVASADARKAIAMFRMEGIDVPILGIVENMAYFEPEELPGKRYYLFGRDGGKKLASQFNIPFLGELPLIPKMGEDADTGNLAGNLPVEMEALAESVARNIAIMNARLPKKENSAMAQADA